MAIENTRSRPRRLSVLGSTGSIGRSTLDVIARDRSSYDIEGLTAYNSVDLLVKQALEFRPRMVAIGNESRFTELRAALAGTGIEVGAGCQALIEVASRSVDWIMAGIVGAAGLAPSLAAVRQGSILAIANKECLVSAGSLFTAEAADHGTTLLPVDSEHNAIFQALQGQRPESVERIILSASGGPFLKTPLEALTNVSPKQAVDHPIWSMGAKISVDSATMMNKGLELIEAHYLFDLEGKNVQLDVLIHPQAIIHGMVCYVDGSVLAQLGTPDMRTPIAYTLAWPARVALPLERLNLAKIGNLSFEEPDLVRFPALRLSREVLAAGGSAPTILNAANEEAVRAFLENKLSYLDIVRVVEAILEEFLPSAPADIDEVGSIDGEARRLACEKIELCTI